MNEELKHLETICCGTEDVESHKVTKTFWGWLVHWKCLEDRWCSVCKDYQPTWDDFCLDCGNDT